MTDGTARPWDLDQYRPGARSALHRATGGGGWDGSIPDGRRIRATYVSDGAPLLLLAGWTAFLTVLTLGLYRFWMVTRLRRHYWRAIRIEGDPLEYTGRGGEKFLGFLIAILILAVYLAFVNLMLAYIGLSIGSEIALNLSLLSAVPLYFVAAYKARRYVMARTRWRGIRFGMERGAWAYGLRALGYAGLTALTAGLLYPLLHFRLEKFMADRTWFGDLRFEQEGSWLGLFAHWVWIYVVAVLMGIAAWDLAEMPADATSQAVGAGTILLGALAILVLLLFYQVAAFRYFWSNRRLGEVRFENDISSWSVLGVYIGGSVAVGLLSMIFAAVLGLAGAMLIFRLSGLDPQALAGMIDAAEGSEMAALASLGAPLLAGLVLFYVIFAAAGYAFTQIFIRQPLIRRMAEHMVIENPGQLRESRQRVFDPAAEAGGFADALGVDLGAGI